MWPAVADGASDPNESAGERGARALESRDPDAASALVSAGGPHPDALRFQVPRFQVLGPVAVSDGANVVVLAPSRPATLLAMLLLYPNTVVSADALVRAIWDREPPATAKAALQTCVLRLRRLFAKHGMAGTDIEAVAGGYRLAAGSQALDLLRFRELARAGRAERRPEAELELLRAALALWHGPLLGNVHSDVVHREEVPRLNEEWLRTVERVFDIELALDRCREILPELLATTGSHPAHERFWEQLIEALYRTGRRAQALSEYKRVKNHLREELGVDPGPGLRNLELRILRGEEIGLATAEPDGRPPTARHTATPLGDGPGEAATGIQVLDRLLGAGLLAKLPEGGYHMHELLYVLTRDAAVSPHRDLPDDARESAS